MGRRSAGLLFGAAVLICAIGPPLLSVIVTSFTVTSTGAPTLRNYARFLTDRYYVDALALTLRIGVETTVVALIVGFAVAFYLVRIARSRLLRRVCYLIVIAPLFTSAIVRSFGWMVALGNNGLINRALLGLGIVQHPVRLLYNELGIVIGLTHILLPFMVLSVVAVLHTIDPTLEQAAADLGAGPLVAFLTVTLPLSLPGVIAGSLIVFSLAVSAYVTPALLSGGRLQVVPMLVFQQYTATFDAGFGSAMAMVLLAITLAVVGVATWMTRTA